MRRLIIPALTVLSSLALLLAGGILFLNRPVSAQPVGTAPQAPAQGTPTATAGGATATPAPTNTPLCGGVNEHFFIATLTGDQEVPPNLSPATGSGTFFLDAGGTMHYNITFSGLTAAETAAHFHVGPPGVAGPVIQPLPPGNPKIGSFAWNPMYTGDLLSGNIYVNIHSQAFPAGEIRGQLVEQCRTPTTTPGASTATSTPAVSSTAVASPTCSAATPTRVATPAFTPGPGCSATPGYNVLDATISSSGGTSQVVIINRSATCSYPVGLATYRMFDNNIDHQELYDYSLAVIPPNTTLTLTAADPPCAYQVDAFYGDILYSFAGGVRYGQRLLDDARGNYGNYCQPTCPGTPVATPTPQPTCAPVATPTRVATPAFTPGPGCSATPGYNVLDGTITVNGGTTQAVIINHSTTCSYPVGLATYRMFDARIDNQELFDYSLDVIGPGETLTLTVANPPCAFQADTFYGDILYSLNGVRYGQRLLDDTLGNQGNYCTHACVTPTVVPGSPTPTPPPTRTLPPSGTVEATATPTTPPTRTVPPSGTVEPTNTPGGVISTATATVVAGICPVTFSDVPPSNPFYSYISCMACQGVVSGYPDGTFRPQNSLTRGQAAKMVASSAQLDLIIRPTRQTFQDVPSSNPFWLWIERVAAYGIINGYPCGGAGEACNATRQPYYRPNTNLTRSQLAKITANAAGWTEVPGTQTFADVSFDNPFYEYIERVAMRGIVNGYPCGGAGEACNATRQPYFRPSNNVTRGQMSKISTLTFYPACPLQ